MRTVSHDTEQTFPEIRDAVRKLCARFPGAYWRALDRERTYPTEFVGALTEAGFLSVLIPEDYLPDLNVRRAMYRRLSEAEKLEDREALAAAVVVPV